MTAAGTPDDAPPSAAPPAAAAPDQADAGVTFDRHLVLEQLGGWRGMVDATLPTVAFIVANSIGGLRPGIWAAVAAAVVIFLIRMVRRESVQQAVSGLVGVGIAVAIAVWTGQARDYFVFGIVRNAGIAALLLASIPLRRPLVGYIAEFLAPSHLGAMAKTSLPGLRRRPAVVVDVPPTGPVDQAGAVDPGPRAPDPEPERHWREDPRLLRAYAWLTVLWGATFALRAAVQGPLYQMNEVGLLGTASLVLGLPLTAVDVGVTLWVVSRLHRHRSGDPAPPA